MTNEMPEHLLAMFTPGAFLFRACSVFLSAPSGKATRLERERYHAILDDLLEAARAGGFENADELDALVLAGGPMTYRLVVLAHLAAHCAGDARIDAVRLKHRLIFLPGWDEMP
jgi:hypothetical protein